MRSWRWSWQWSWLSTAVWPVVVVLLLGLGRFDYMFGGFGLLDDAFTRLDATTTGPLMLGSALLSCAALLLWPRLGARGLPLATGVAAVVSLGTTTAVHVIASLPVGEEETFPVDDPAGLTEPAALHLPSYCGDRDRRDSWGSWHPGSASTTPSSVRRRYGS